MRVSAEEKRIPEITVMANGLQRELPSPPSISMGSIERITLIVVIKTGLNFSMDVFFIKTVISAGLLLSRE
jgi:hypothetical protein